MKKTIIGGFLSLIGSIWTLAILIAAGNNLVSSLTTPPGRLLSTAPEEARRLAATLPAPRLAALVQTTEELQRYLRQNMNQTLFLTRMSACLRQAAGL